MKLMSSCLTRGLCCRQDHDVLLEEKQQLHDELTQLRSEARGSLDDGYMTQYAQVSYMTQCVLVSCRKRCAQISCVSSSMYTVFDNT